MHIRDDSPASLIISVDFESDTSPGYLVYWTNNFDRETKVVIIIQFGRMAIILLSQSSSFFLLIYLICFDEAETRNPAPPTRATRLQCRRDADRRCPALSLSLSVHYHVFCVSTSSSKRIYPTRASTAVGCSNQREDVIGV
jgi:hypothetical protein